MDLVTPLVTQVTYEGMIDEILGIKNNVVHVDVTDRSGSVERKRYVLNSNDAMHGEMRDVPWHRAAPKIRDWVQKMKRDWHSIKQDTSSKSVSEMRDFAKRFLFNLSGIQKAGDADCCNWNPRRCTRIFVNQLRKRWSGKISETDSTLSDKSSTLTRGIPERRGV